VVRGERALGPFVEAAGRVWFPGRRGDEQRFYAIDPEAGQVVAATDPVPAARWLASGPAGLWAVTGPNELRQLDARSGRALRTITTTQSVYDVHVDREMVYAGAGDGGNGITVVDPATGQSQVALPDVATGPVVLAPDGDLWVQDLARPALVRIDGATMSEEVVIPLPGGTSTAAQREYLEGWGDHVLAYPVVDGSSVYVVVNPRGRRLLLRADARTGEVTHVFETGSGNFGGPAAVSDGSIWLASRHVEPLVRRITPFS
jgi:streptogramin lyase